MAIVKEPLEPIKDHLGCLSLYSARTKTLDFHADMAGILVIPQASDRLFLWQREPF